MSKDINDVILEIYESASLPNHWSSTMKSIANILNADGVHFFAKDKYNEDAVFGAISHRYSDINKLHYKAQYPKDPRANLITQQPVGKIVRAEELVTSEQINKSPNLQKHMKKFRCANVTGANLGVSGYDAWLGIGRWPPDTPFDKDEIKKLNSLLPHLRKALRLQLQMKELELSSQGLTALWNATQKAIFFIDANKKIIFSNNYAEKLIDSSWLQSSNQALSFTNPHTNKIFQKSLDATLQTKTQVNSNQDAFLAIDSRNNEYGVRVIRYINHDEKLNFSSSFLAMIMITPLGISNSPRLIDLRSFSKLYDLTIAEEQVFIALANDMDLKEFSGIKNIKIDTARKQLKSVLAKTGLNNQKQLVRLIDRYCFLQLQ
ncbi:MAG: hypothetical protein ABJN57_07620 [Hyphomicrobiales bacterium]